MAVVLTGDVHQRLPAASDQQFANESEAALAADYARVADRFGLRVTLYFTARAILEDGADATVLRQMENVEIGGHGWDAFHPRWRQRAVTAAFSSPHGPRWFQRRMIDQTCAVLRHWGGSRIVSWRNHAYQYDKNTARLLAQAGIRSWSDDVDLERRRPYAHPDGVVILPINTLPDHEHLYHGARTAEAVAREGRGASYTPSEWCKLVCSQADEIVRAGGIATVLAHPICMKIADDWRTFERLCDQLAKYRSLFAREAALDHITPSAH